MDASVLNAVNVEIIVTSVDISENTFQRLMIHLHVHLSPKLIRRSTRRKHKTKHIVEYNKTTTETGKASIGILPLIEGFTETSSTDTGQLYRRYSSISTSA
jgi:hypothetical protein